MIIICIDRHHKKKDVLSFFRVCLIFVWIISIFFVFHNPNNIFLRHNIDHKHGKSSSDTSPPTKPAAHKPSNANVKNTSTSSNNTTTYRTIPVPIPNKKHSVKYWSMFHEQHPMFHCLGTKLSDRV